MTKDKFIYELIDKCMIIVCQNNILVENFALCDEHKFYIEMEKQFMDCIKLYDEMYELLNKNEINEKILDEELGIALSQMRQNAVRQLLQNFEKILSEMCIQNKDTLIIEIEGELQKRNIDAEYLLTKVQMIRNLEQESSSGKRGVK